METEIKKEENTEINLDRKSKILFVVLAILIAGSVAVTYWRYMVKRDYIIQAQIDCDPETQNCLVWKCDPMSLEEGEDCTGVPDNDIWYYKIFNRNAKNIPDCDPKDENCAAYQCDPGEPECETTSCSPDNIKKGEECSAPEQYLKDNPPEEEASADEECLPDDEECLNAQNTKCDPETEDCSESSSEECAPGDENCAPAQGDETAPDSSGEAPADGTNF
jgi:hypothetical protein